MRQFKQLQLRKTSKKARKFYAVAVDGQNKPIWRTATYNSCKDIVLEEMTALFGQTFKYVDQTGEGRPKLKQHNPPAAEEGTALAAA